MSTLTAHSHGPDGSDLRKRYQYLLLEQVWRDACSDPWTWETLTYQTSDDGESVNCEYRNKDTGVIIRCESSGYGHTLTLITEGKT
jgi:hypothetical protein